MKRICYALTLMALFTIAQTAHAKTWTITFAPFAYTDSSITVNVGDTIVWSGSFPNHPLTLASSPAGVVTFSHVTAGNVGNNFQYVVTATGVYHYHCDNHFAPPLNMTGSFTAVASGVSLPPQTTMTMNPIYPNPAMDEAMVDFTLKDPAHVTLRIYNASGSLMQTPTNETMSAGDHMLMIDTKDLPSGNYQYVLQSGDDVLRRAMIVVK